MKKILLIAIGVISLYGCAMQSDLVDLENELRRMKGIVLETQRDVSLLQKSQQSAQQEQLVEQMRENMAKFGGETKDMLEMLQKNQADFEIRFDQLATDVQVIQGRLEENNHRLSELSEGIDDQEAAIQELSRKIDIIEARMGDDQRGSDRILLPGKDVESDKGVRPVKPDTSPMLPVAPSPLPPPQSLKPPSVSPSEGTGTTPIAPSDLYNQAYKDYMAGNYDLAISGFSNYLSQIPSGSLAPNALYWIGESYYSKGDYTKAVTAFESVTIDYPKSEKIVGALLKMGYSYEKMGNKEMSVVYFKKVIEQFPYSQEASLAKVKLTELK